MNVVDHTCATSHSRIANSHDHSGASPSPVDGPAATSAIASYAEPPNTARSSGAENSQRFGEVWAITSVVTGAGAAVALSFLVQAMVSSLSIADRARRESPWSV